MTRSRNNAVADGPVVLAVVSDLHVGSSVGLCPASTPLDDGGEYRASKAQRWLLGCWQDAWGKVYGLRDKHKAALWVVVNGDAVDGDHHQTYQLWSRSPEEQIGVAEEMLAPVRTEAEQFFLIRGTEAHVGGSAWMEERLAGELEATPDKDRGTASWWHLRLLCNGVRFDCAHHTSMGRLPWTRANSANRTAAETVMAYAESGDAAPHVVVRSHQHRWAESGTNYATRAVFTPAWQLATAFTQRLAPAAVADIGLVLFVCEGGEYDMRPLRYHPKRKPYWTPQPQASRLTT